MSTSRSRIEFATRAVRGLRRLTPAERRRVREALDALVAGAVNVDVKVLAGRDPWLRMRVGDWRVIYRPLSEKEAASGGSGWLVARVINRRDLERAMRVLS